MVAVWESTEVNVVSIPLLKLRVLDILSLWGRLFHRNSPLSVKLRIQ